jgi:hypothetical protein
MKHVLHLFLSGRESQVCILNHLDGRKPQNDPSWIKIYTLDPPTLGEPMAATALTAMTEANFDRLRLLPDRGLGSLHRFRDFHHRRSRFRIGFELPDVVLGPRTANGSLLFRHGVYSLKGLKVRIIVSCRERFD